MGRESTESQPVERGYKMNKAKILKKNVENRDLLIESLRAELIGPIPVNKNVMQPLEISEKVEFDNLDATFEYYYNAQSGDEILQKNTPIMQYSTAILFPHNSENEMMEEIHEEENIHDEIEILSEEAKKELERMASKKSYDFEDIPDLMPGKNDFNPSSIGLSFYLEIGSEEPILTVNLEGGIYKPFEVVIKPDKKNKEWWYRCNSVFTDKQQPIQFNLKEAAYKKRVVQQKIVEFEHLTFQIQVYTRKLDEKLGMDSKILVTVSATNITANKNKREAENILFQSQLSVELKNREDAFLPYPSSFHELSDSNNEEMLTSQLLYRNTKNYALGHGCSADWREFGKEKSINKIYSSFLPEQEMINMTPDINDKYGNKLSLSMMELAGVKPGSRPVTETLTILIESYESWIEQREKEIAGIQEEWLKPAANRHINQCKEALGRMRKGLSCLEDQKVLKAFKMANYAMAVQQDAGKELREGKIENGKVVMKKRGSYDLPTESQIALWSEKKANWRAFQAAFLLMSIPSFCGDKAERELVDLIWFPTGGGKTEAYLGTASFSMFLRRLKNPEDAGTDVLMRYTLRLLTADQFQRSSRLICTMEIMRKKEEKILGETPFSIGIWLGGTTTPNRHKDAKDKLSNWKNGDETEALLLKNCPWCGAHLGEYKNNDLNKKDYKGNRRKKIDDQLNIKGYKIERGSEKLIIHCPDEECQFNEKLPVYIVDETIYEVKPSFLIGTVDKFAMLAWKPEARSIFGINKSGERIVSPPNLIIQDELHLISGPLGSVTGLYEVLVENLCTDFREGINVKPKIIAATATVRGYKEQANALYARGEEKVSLFPSPGLTYDDSFFAKVHVGEDGRPSPGKKYIGIASSLVGLQTIQVKTYTTLLQKTMEFEDNEKDPFWTLLSFYNSIRELGGSLTLFQTDIPSYFMQFRNKHKIPKSTSQRSLKGFKELTSRLSNGEVTDAIGELKKEFDKGEAADVCLASSIIEVGVDIERLSLMTVVGQPKNTAQYIQVTGRVGRKWDERPGLVVTLYKSNVSRDKSHFEHFKEYHQKLYTQVEATSVTPFSDPCVTRGLYGVIIGWLRQSLDSNIAISPSNIDMYVDELNKFKAIILERVRMVDEGQLSVVEKLYEKYVIHMLNSQAQKWEKKSNNPSYFLMHSAGEYVEERYKETAKPVLTSMRNVDASCKGVITNIYGRSELIE